MRSSWVFIVLLICASCGGRPEAVPKPRAYPKVTYPERNYTTLSDPACDFTFEYPDYLTFEQKTSFFGDTPDHPCWFNLVADEFLATIHFSYVPVTEEQPFFSLVNDAFTIANKINQRSNYMDEIRVGNEQGVHGLIMEFQGPAASPMHFFLSDTSTHFVKASLYYNSQVRPDSLAPITEFIKTDIARIINTFAWQ